MTPKPEETIYIFSGQYYKIFRSLHRINYWTGRRKPLLLLTLLFPVIPGKTKMSLCLRTSFDFLPLLSFCQPSVHFSRFILTSSNRSDSSDHQALQIWFGAYTWPPHASTEIISELQTTRTPIRALLPVSHRRGGGMLGQETSGVPGLVLQLRGQAVRDRR